MKEHEVELIDYLRVLWRQKWIILITLAASILTAGVLSQMVTPNYRAEASLLLLPPLASELGAEAQGSTLEPDAYLKFALSTAVIRSLIEIAELPEWTTIVGLRNRLGVSMDPLLVSEDRYAQVNQVLLTFTVTGSSREELARIAQAWIGAFEKEFGELFLDRTARSFTYIQSNYVEVRSELANLRQERISFLSENPLDIINADLSALLGKYSSDTSQLLDANLDLVKVRQYVAALEEELSQQNPTYVLRRSLNPDSLVAALASGISAGEVDMLVGLQVEEEVLNETFVELDRTIAFARADVAELEARISYLEGSIDQTRRELEIKQGQALEAETVLAELDQQIALLRSTETKLAEKLQDAKIALAETPDPIRVIDEPLIAARPVSPKKQTNIAIAGFLGLMVGVLFAFLVDYINRARTEDHKHKKPERPVGVGLEKASCQDSGRDSCNGSKEERQKPQKYPS